MNGPDPGDLFAAHAADTMRSGHNPQHAPPTPGPVPDGTVSEHAADDLLTALLHWIHAHGGDPETAVASAYHRWQSSMLTARAATYSHLPATPLPPPLPERPFTLLHHLLAALDEPSDDEGGVLALLGQIFRDHGWPPSDPAPNAPPPGGRTRPADTNEHQDPDNP